MSRFEWFAIVTAAAVAMFFSAPFANAAVTMAPLVMHGEDDNGGPVEFRITSAPCTDAAVIGHLIRNGLPADNLNTFRAATLLYGGKMYAACWTVYRGAVCGIDEDGEIVGGRCFSKDAFTVEDVI